MEEKQIVNVPSGKNIEIVIRVFDNPSSAVVVNDDSELKNKLKEAEERAAAVKEMATRRMPVRNLFISVIV